MSTAGRDSRANQGYRISELVDASGVSRDMIKYYLRAGMLPHGEKPRPNLSLYTDTHLELIGLIHKFQAQTKLSLPEIAGVFQAAGHDPVAIGIELLAAEHRIQDGDNIIPLPRETRDRGSLAVPEDFLEQLAGTALIEDGTDVGTDERAALLWAASNAGVPLPFFERTKQTLAGLADLEVKALIAIKRPGLNFAETMDNVTEVDRLINRWMIAEKNRQIRERFQRVIDNSQRAISTIHDTIYRPSPLFRSRHAVDELLEHCAAGVLAGGDDPVSRDSLCFAALQLGDFTRAIDIAHHTLARQPGDPVATAYIALAHGLQDHVDAAFDYGMRLEDSDVYHPAILQARILSLLLKAAKQGGVTDATELMRNAGELFLELPERPGVEEPEAILLLARGNIAFPDFANSVPRAIQAVEALLEGLDGDLPILPGLPDSDLTGCLRLVYRIYALYYLGRLRQMAGDAGSAQACFERVIQLDPASNFGEHAYLQLA